MTCKSVLVVEDDHDIRETIQAALEMEGYAVTAAANGQQALDALPKMARPCLILLDLMMPVMNGWQFVEEMHKDITLATIPVVVVTAYAERADGIKVRTVIKKPINLDLLLHVVGGYCDGIAA